jgi:AraC family transcriptional regulator
MHRAGIVFAASPVWLRLVRARQKNVALTNERKIMPEFSAQTLLRSPAITIRDVYCPGSCSPQSAEECATATELVFPYRGVYVRHLGQDQAVAEANQVLFFNATEGYRVSHPVPGGDATLSLAVSQSLLHELAPLRFCAKAQCSHFGGSVCGSMRELKC